MIMMMMLLVGQHRKLVHSGVEERVRGEVKQGGVEGRDGRFEKWRNWLGNW